MEHGGWGETRVVGRWKPPSAGEVKINFDRAVFEEENEGGFGVVARSAEGECIAWSSHHYIKPVFPKLVEAIAARETAALVVLFEVGKELLVLLVPLLWALCVF
ncbi:UNVERIFIED_CONTAM: hypothetical protein Sradi_1333700 [Sesamum radiatum]|uniref:RNase H type-1 domain-containing protein n=1 Tax=Sesamum radiatum TaxID=300843 RepID=A0AAW2UQK8_SESRA